MVTTSNNSNSINNSNNTTHSEVRPASRSSSDSLNLCRLRHEAGKPHQPRGSSWQVGGVESCAPITAGPKTMLAAC